MTDQLENQTMADTQPTYEPPQALRMGNIHTGAGGGQCALPGSADMAVSGCRSSPGADTDCSTGDGARSSCTDIGNSAGSSGD
jgi:hypothetical protein